MAVLILRRKLFLKSGLSNGMIHWMALDPLIEVSQFVEKQARVSRVAVIFDLDSTLFCVSPRTQAILRKLGHQREFGEAHVDAAKVLRAVEVLPTDWGVRTVLERNQVAGSVELFKTIRNFWRKHFFANHFLDRDEIYPSANEYVGHLHELGADILYLTGRGEGSMREGTIKMLKHWGFPFYAESKLYMKPRDVETDEGFKADVLLEIARGYDHVWFFENEPVIIEQVRLKVPQVRVVYMNSVHSGRAAPPKDLPTIGMSYITGLPKKD
jgi:hypothetical protein